MLWERRGQEDAALPGSLCKSERLRGLRGQPRETSTNQLPFAFLRFPINHQAVIAVGTRGWGRFVLEDFSPVRCQAAGASSHT